MPGMDGLTLQQRPVDDGHRMVGMRDPDALLAVVRTVLGRREPSRLDTRGSG
jgi:hypothetical protein